MKTELPTTTCRSCGAEIIWATVESGKKMPFNSEPRSDARENRGPLYRLVKVGPDVTAFNVDDEVVYVTHFATCPDAAAWRHERLASTKRKT